MTTKQTTSVIHHVTDHRNIKTIQKKGIHAGHICSEANLAGCQLDDLMMDHELNIEERTRDMFNQILNHNKPHRTLPSHDQAVFFWSDDKTARYHRSAMDRKNPLGNYHIVKIYHPLIPCQCYEADFQKAEDLFEHIEKNIDDIERIENTGPETKEDKTIIKKADQLAKQYYKTMRPYKGIPNPDKEVVCPCSIPKKAIVRIL